MFDPITATIGSAVISGGLGFLGAQEQTGAAEDAARMNMDATDRATQLQREMYNTSRADMAPWRDVGGQGLYTLADLMGIQATDKNGNLIPMSDKFGYLTKPFDYNNWKDPGYDFRFNQGVQAMDRSASAKGNLFSGGYNKALTQYGQDYGSNEFMNAYNRYANDQNNLYNRYAGVSGTGQTASSQMGNWGMNSASTIGNMGMTGAQNAGNAYQNAAAATASGYANIGNAVNSGVSNYLYLNNMNQQPNYNAGLRPPPTYDTYTGLNFNPNLSYK